MYFNHPTLLRVTRKKNTGTETVRTLVNGAWAFTLVCSFHLGMLHRSVCCCMYSASQHFGFFSYFSHPLFIPYMDAYSGELGTISLLFSQLKPRCLYRKVTELGWKRFYLHPMLWRGTYITQLQRHRFEVVFYFCFPSSAAYFTVLCSYFFLLKSL